MEMLTLLKLLDEVSVELCHARVIEVRGRRAKDGEAVPVLRSDLALVGVSIGVEDVLQRI